MSWKDCFVQFVKKYGAPAKVVACSVLSVVAPWPVVKLVEKVFDTAQDAAQGHWEAELLRCTQQNAAELVRLGNVFELLNGDLANLCDKAFASHDQPDNIEDIVRRALAADHGLADGLRKLNGLCGGMVCVQQQQRHLLAGQGEILRRLDRVAELLSAGESVPFGLKAAARFLFVCSQGLGEFQTLREGLEAARDGDKIYVLPGVYRESLRIEKSVEIVGQGELPEDVVIESDDDIVYLQAPCVAIHACCFRTLKSGRFGLVAANSQPSTVTLCKFKSPEGTGIVAVDGSRLLVEECTFEGCKHGVRVDAAYAAIVGNKFDSNSNGILIHSGCESVIENNDFADNDVSSVQLHDDTAARISRNRFRGGVAAIVIAHTSRGSIQIQENHFFGHTEQTAIVAMGDNAVAIQDNYYQ